MNAHYFESKFISVDTTLFSPKSSTIKPYFFPKFSPNSISIKTLTLVLKLLWCSALLCCRRCDA